MSHLNLIIMSNSKKRRLFLSLRTYWYPEKSDEEIMAIVNEMVAMRRCAYISIITALIAIVSAIYSISIL
jgi:hypothetical protein